MATFRCPFPLGRDPFQRPTRTPGPLGHNDAASPDTPMSFVGDTPGPLGINDLADPNVNIRARAKANTPITTNGKWDPEAAAAFLKDPANGWAGLKPKHRCARAVRQAVNAGHLATPNNPVPAADYKDYLPRLGFSQVPLTGYTPQVGDVAVFPAIPDSNVYGHIEMYTGECWQSDYIQPGKPVDGKYGTGFFASTLWAKTRFVIFRKRGSK